MFKLICAKLCKDIIINPSYVKFVLLYLVHLLYQSLHFCHKQRNGNWIETENQTEIEI